LSQSKALITAGQDKLMEVIRAEGTVFASQLASAEFKEAVTAFLERRPPDFSRAG
jgi:enoyl-CoA hydratase/carnithine racemase